MIKEEVLDKKDTISRQEIPIILYEFLDTLLKIRKINDVVNVCFVKELTDIYVITARNDADLSEHIMEKFAMWEASYKIFPELHIIDQEEMFYIPEGASCI